MTYSRGNLFIFFFIEVNCTVLGNFLCAFEQFIIRQFDDIVKLKMHILINDDNDKFVVQNEKKKI